MGLSVTSSLHFSPRAGWKIDWQRGYQVKHTVRKSDLVIQKAGDLALAYTWQWLARHLIASRVTRLVTGRAWLDFLYRRELQTSIVLLPLTTSAQVERVAVSALQGNFRPETFSHRAEAWFDASCLIDIVSKAVQHILLSRAASKPQLSTIRACFPLPTCAPNNLSPTPTHQGATSLTVLFKAEPNMKLGCGFASSFLIFSLPRLILQLKHCPAQQTLMLTVTSPHMEKVMHVQQHSKSSRMKVLPTSWMTRSRSSLEPHPVLALIPLQRYLQQEEQTQPVRHIRQVTTASIRWDPTLPVSGPCPGLHRLVIFAVHIRLNATKANQSANIARTTISSAVMETCLFRNRTSK